MTKLCLSVRSSAAKSRWRERPRLSQTEWVSYQDDPIGFEERLRAKLQPANLRATMAFAGLYQITNEMIRHAVIDKVRDFYWIDLEGNGAMSTEDREQYRLQVLSLDRREFTASLLWLVNSKAITQAQADRLSAVHAHRNELTHELVRFIVDADADPDIGLFSEALSILKDLHRFWIDVELSTGGFFLPDGTTVDDVDPDEVTPASLMVLQQCIDAYVEGFETPRPFLGATELKALSVAPL